jgi:hypothetical protein
LSAQSAFQGHWFSASIAAILIGGCAAGFLDIMFAIVRNGTLGIPAMAVLQSIASGLVGKAAFHGGIPMAMFGLILHFAMTIAMAAIFVMVSGRIAAARRHWFASGLLMGAAAFTGMNYIVVPLSRFPAGGLPFSASVLAAHLFLVGLPIALAAHFFGSGVRRSSFR